MNWWWSEQLCLFTAGAWTIFVYSECQCGVQYSPLVPILTDILIRSSSIRDSTRLGVYVDRPARGYFSCLQPFLSGSASPCPYFVGYEASIARTSDNRLVANLVFPAHDLRHASRIWNFLFPAQSSHHACTSYHPPCDENVPGVACVVFDQASLRSRCCSLLIHPWAYSSAPYSSQWLVAYS